MDKETLYIKSWAEFFGDIFEVIGLGAFKIIFGFIVGQKNKKMYNRFVDNRKNYFGDATDEEIKKYLSSLATEIKALENQSFLTTLKNRFKGKKGINQFLFTTDIYEADDFKNILCQCSTFNNYKTFQNGMLMLLEDTVKFAMNDVFSELSDKEKVGFSLVISEMRYYYQKLSENDQEIIEKIEQLENVGQVVNNYSEEKPEEGTLKYIHHKCFYCGHTGSHLKWPKNNNKSDQKTIFCCACGNSYDVRVETYTEENRNLLQKGFNKLESIYEEMKQLATKEEMKQLATKEDITALEKTMFDIWRKFEKILIEKFNEKVDTPDMQLMDYEACVNLITDSLDEIKEDIKNANNQTEIKNILQIQEQKTQEKLNDILKSNQNIQNSLKKIEVACENIESEHIYSRLFNCHRTSSLYALLYSCLKNQKIVIQKGFIELDFSTSLIKNTFEKKLEDNEFYKLKQAYECIKKIYHSTIQSGVELPMDVSSISNEIKQLFELCNEYASYVNANSSFNNSFWISFINFLYKLSSNKLTTDCNYIISNKTLLDFSEELSLLNVPEGIITIKKRALSGKKLDSLIVSSTVTKIEGPDDKDYNSVEQYLKGVKKIQFNNNRVLREIPSYMLFNNSNVEIINFPDSICIIESQAFYKCEKLRSTLQTFFSQHYDLTTATQWVDRVINSGEEWKL